MAQKKAHPVVYSKCIFLLGKQLLKLTCSMGRIQASHPLIKSLTLGAFLG